MELAVFGLVGCFCSRADVRLELVEAPRDHLFRVSGSCGGEVGENGEVVVDVESLGQMTVFDHTTVFSQAFLIKNSFRTLKKKSVISSLLWVAHRLVWVQV